MEQFIKKTLDLLKENPEWERRYAGYLTEVWNRSDKWQKPFRKAEGLSLYTSLATRNEKIYFLRFKGQNVGKISVRRNGDVVLTSLVKESKSHEIKGIIPYKVSVDWHSKEASKFRREFRDISKETKTKSPEHHVENSLLKEFRKRNGDEKPIRNIQPVLLHGHFFQMPTPLKASDHDPKYVGKGGGIDLMARIRDINGHVRLCVCEVKDDNKNKESQKATMSQALIYGTFIAKLLTEQPEWWEVFAGHSTRRDNISKSWDKKHIEVVTIMPTGSTETFDDKELMVPGTDFILVCRALYYDKEEFEKNNNNFKFTGTFLNDIKK